jgi:4-aminobutyrate aminotransferase/(S)-3-amino-2-methylpropionate transaminase
MATYSFNLRPRVVNKIRTKNRVIKTKIPTPQSIKIISKIKKYESSNAVQQLPVIWDKAKNHQIFDPYGNKWIDFTSSIFVANTGHGNPFITKEISKYLKKPLLHSYYYPTKIRMNFLEKLIKISPSYLDRAILLSAGTEATERAIKIAKIFGKKNKKKYIIAWEGNYHGKTLNAQMISGQYEDHKWIQKFDKNIIHLPFPYPWVLKKKNVSGKKLFHIHLTNLKKKINLKEISSFFVESFQGWGAIFYPKDYIKELEKFSKKNKSLLVFDEIQAGFYRTGKLFAFEHYKAKPDLVICGKGISGSLPLSAVIGKSKYINLDSAYTSTHGGNPVACAASLGNLKVFDNKKFHQSLREKTKIMKHKVNQWKKLFPSRIKTVLGNGLIWGVFISSKNGNKLDYNLTNKICERAMEKGVFSICTGRGTLKLGPPLTIPKSALIEGLNVYEECFKKMF